MLFVYVVIGLLTLGMGFVFTNLKRSITNLSQEHCTLRKEHMNLHIEYMELQKYCCELETRIQYLERSRRLLSYIVKHANVRGSTSKTRELCLPNKKIS
ncbi:hypothetical protein GCM10025859_42440 [Alicyclobacillus fastidiosus]|nr:hypothetical protein GCM10025859_42440 [Alicyclobacillus fastidiosus]